MGQAECTKADHIYYGFLCAAVACVGIAQIIRACRSRPKVQMVVLSVKPLDVKQPAKPGPEAVESSSAAE